MSRGSNLDAEDTRQRQKSDFKQLNPVFSDEKVQFYL